MNWINDIILRAMDGLMGWLLMLPRDARLVGLAVLTALILVLVRRFTTDQDMLRRCGADRARLKLLMKIAKRNGDKEALKRYRATRGMIAMTTSKAELKPLLVSLVPIAILATWAFQRVAFIPPQADQPVTVTMYLPAWADGQIVHMVPGDGATCQGGFVQQARLVPQGQPPHAEATWQVHLPPREEPYQLQFRSGRGTYEKPVIVGQRIYAPPVATFTDGNVLAIETRLTEAKLLGVVPGLGVLALAPWMTAYFIISIPSLLLLKRLLRIR